MPRARKKTQPDINGMTAKQMRRKKPINSDYLLNIEPLTDNQRLMFEPVSYTHLTLPTICSV